MTDIVNMIKNVTFFLLAATLIANLFADTEYKKYFLYAAGLIVISLALSPVWSLLGKTEDFAGYLRQAMDSQQAEEIEEQMRILGEEAERE